MNKKGGEKLLSIWWFFVLMLIGGGIFIGVLIYYSVDININEIKDKNSMQQNYYYNQMGVDIKITDNFVISADFINEKGRRPFGIYNSNRLFDQFDNIGDGYFNNNFLNYY